MFNNSFKKLNELLLYGNKKEYVNTYKIKSTETIQRDRRYSIHDEIDYDECLTERKIQKNG